MEFWDNTAFQRKFYTLYLQESGGYLIEQQLTVEEVPVIVDKCINFISTHGTNLSWSIIASTRLLIVLCDVS